jgi:ABC-type hemin transport system substrate-binding protein
MKDRRGAIGRATELAESVVAGVKRRQAARAPKVLLYDEAGRPRTIAGSSDAAGGLVETAREMVELVGPDEHATVDVPEEE